MVFGDSSIVRQWQAMRTAQERCKDELEKLADQRLQLRLAQAQVQQLKPRCFWCLILES